LIDTIQEQEDRRRKAEESSNEMCEMIDGGYWIPAVAELWMFKVREAQYALMRVTTRLPEIGLNCFYSRPYPHPYPYSR
jgi:hypothetical protein